ncbi:MAG: hypothetical protein ABIP49_07025, partial [Lysobacterales bacterium]
MKSIKDTRMQVTRIFNWTGAFLVGLALGGCAVEGSASKSDNATPGGEGSKSATPDTAAPSVETQ